MNESPRHLSPPQTADRLPADDDIWELTKKWSLADRRKALTAFYHYLMHEECMRLKGLPMDAWQQHLERSDRQWQIACGVCEQYKPEGDFLIALMLEHDREEDPRPFTNVVCKLWNRADMEFLMRGQQEGVLSMIAGKLARWLGPVSDES